MIAIITVLKNSLFNIISLVKTNFSTIAVIIIGILTAFLFIQNNKLTKYNQDIDRLNNNILYYQEQMDSTVNDNRTLQLTIEDFKHSNDSIINKLDQVREDLKIKDKELIQAQAQQQEIKLDTTVVVQEDNFTKEIKPNNLTSLLIIKKDSFLTAKLDIKNEQFLYLASKREYKRQYKNFFRRLCHFDFKKRTVYKYEIHNTNDLIEVTNTRLIQISE